MPTLLSDASRREGHRLAARHVLGPSVLRDRALRRRLRSLDRDFAKVFRQARDELAGNGEKRVAPGGWRWLLENDFIIAEALEELDGALPPAFLARLPGLRHPEPSRGMTRVEVLAQEIVRRDGGRVEIEEILPFLTGYQEVRSLRLAELWALPAFLRLALLEELLAHVQGSLDRIEVGPYILSLRTLAGEDWRDIVESLSRVEEVLREDPAGVYPAMDFRTRDRFRKQVERIATRAKIEEDVVARQVLELARGSAMESREGHVGFYLIDEGRGALLRELGIRPAWNGIPSLRRMRLGWMYFGGIGVLTVAFLAVLWGLAEPVGLLALAFLPFGLVVGLGLAVSLTNRLAGQFTAPRALPRLDVRAGIPEAFRTVVAVPCLLGSREDVDDLLHTLETNYQANSDPALTFALVSDFPDAPSQRLDGEEAVLSHAALGIRALNERHGKGRTGPFLLLHRPRRWNPVEGVWMGWERKRGKLAEFNLLLLGRPSDLWVVEGAPERLEDTPFVLTLDADTRLPRNAAARLVGTMAHPLNRPEVGAGGKILRGYSVLQPRIEILPDPDGGTLFSRVSGGIQGLDLYAHASFDVYQDLFDQGIFAGKGIYDVRAFEGSLAGRTPENALLSHDLFEGAHGRAGLVSDLILLEDFPGHLLAHTRRTHRWIRGDWQISPWLLPRVPGERGERLRNPLNGLSRWMIFDNLRRSVQPIAILLLLIAGWIFLPEGALAWSFSLAALIGLPFLLGSVDAAFRFLRHLPRRADFEAERRAVGRALGRWFLDLSLLPLEAWNAADAIVRACHRMGVSRRGLLEWTTAAATSRILSASGSMALMLRHVRVGPLLAFSVAGGLILRPGAFPLVATPFLVLWALSPLLAHTVSRSRGPLREPRGEFPRVRARAVARRIWGYYERFQRSEQHWLAPDHFQEDPGAEVAHRTSPTNIGMAMTAAVTAWDLGFLGTPGLLTRLRDTVDGMERLTRHRGHFLNWYDTSNLEPLHPLYVSTVDSGNLAAALLVTRETLREVRTSPVIAERRVESLQDTSRVVSEILREMRGDGGAQALALEVEALTGWIERRLGAAWTEGLTPYVRVLEELLEVELPKVEAHFLQIHETSGEASVSERWSAVHAWMGHLRGDADRALTEVTRLFPWVSVRHESHAGIRELHARIIPETKHIPSLVQMASRLEAEMARARTQSGTVESVGSGDPGGEGREHLGALLDESLSAVRLLLEDIDRVSTVLELWFEEMDFSFLYDSKRELFRIGFSVSGGELDANHYDLLASEARIASAVAIAKGEAPPAHWLHLGRPFIWTDRGPLLVSWAGTMFEYLMPTLFLRMPPETVLEEACRRAVQVQVEYGRRERIPWGISESGYHVLSPEGHYQYRAFGVPTLGLRRNAGSRVVVAPYASLMAVSFAPGAALRNLEHITQLDGMGPWGPYEALDFGRKSEWKYEPRVVRSYMSHHHGMILAALGNHLTGHRLVDRFHRDPRIGTIEPYLFERIPWRRSVERKWVDRSVAVIPGGSGGGVRSWSPPVDRVPAPIQHLASGKLVVSLGPDGRGGSRWGDWSVIRGEPGPADDGGGADIIVLDRTSDESWRPLPDPLAPPSDDQQIVFEPHRAEFMRKTRGLRTRMDVFLPPVAGVEVRQFVFANESSRPRFLRMALAAELALAPAQDDLRHPAFQKLFVRAEALSGGEGLLFERRPRSEDESPPVLLAAILGAEGPLESLKWGTSREAFLGRRGSRTRPQALLDPHLLAPPTGPHHPLDPMACAVLDVDLPPWGDFAFTVLLAVGPDRATVLKNAAELRSPRRRDWARIQARARAEGELIRLEADAESPAVWNELLAQVLRPRGMVARIPPEFDRTLDLRQSSLWRWGISGDIPFILVEGDSGDGSPVLADLVRAQRWWRARGQLIDLVVIGKGVGEYQDLLRDRVRVMLSSVGAEEALGRPGGIHVVRADDMGTEEQLRLRALAAVTIQATAPSLEAEVVAGRRAHTPLSRIVGGVSDLRRSVASPGVDRSEASPPLPPESGGRLIAPSAFGGFDPESGEYVIRLRAGEVTPAPWVNLIARDRFGFLVTESGGGFTWAEDAGEFRLTPWHNDPVLGSRGEVLYLRDDEDGKVWTPAPGPLGLERTHEVRHGWGRTSLEVSGDEVDEKITWFLHPSLPVKVVRLSLKNRGTRPRRFSAFYFADWVLGSRPDMTSGRLQVQFDAHRSAVTARNPYSLKFPQRIAFLASDRRADGMATDREEFLGMAGPLERVPIGLLQMQPGERTVPNGRPCAVIRRQMVLYPGEEAEVSFFLGTAEKRDALDGILETLRPGESSASDERGPDLADAEAMAWRGYLGRVRVRTPEAGLDQLMNGWLPYQTISSRLRGRTGFYQSGGAFGFRDQLQDSYALLPLDPSRAVTQLAEAARRQFIEGDVLHWWHPDTLRGVRTRCSDDLLWLPWVLAQTVRWTGDPSVLDLSVPYLAGPVLAPDEDENYDLFSESEVQESLWEHALRAVSHTASLLSPRGLPLMGTGDWNDGMDRVGKEGRGESIWLGWFFIDTCRLLLPIARARGEGRTVLRLEEWSTRVCEAVEAHGWDGEWYRRAFFDDGTPLGSRDSREARIDSIAQSWGVLSEAADPTRARIALESAWRELVKERDGIVLLLAPPFAGEGPNPGYIAAYPPGVRENGGQYTHAAAWLLRAFARVGDGERAGALLRLLLPTRHAEGREGTERYRVEPYVIAADVYGVEPHLGRGGWTWYTGSAGWLWRVTLEDVLGVRRDGAALRVDPCIPSGWDGFDVDIWVDDTLVEIRVRNPARVSQGVKRCLLDGVEVDHRAIPLFGGATGGERTEAPSAALRVEILLGS
ncbi:MAG: glucoamylase family protein [Gemmatimonadota bacterium]